MVRHGMSNRRIAAARGTSLEAVKFHVDNIRQKLDLPTRRSIRTWRGQPGHARSSALNTSEPITSGRLGQVSFVVRDLEGAVAFFRDTLDLRHLYTFGDLAFFDCGDTRLFVSALAESQGAGNSVLYFRVDDIQASAAALRATGVEFAGEPHLIHRHPGGEEEWMAFFNGPEGNTLALMSLERPAG